ncbi:uncharacterized protein [Dysidea avara]|uniref:uncharacterized protein n=1 Tax=Dysidea avara TaxID=196820 RepID=UPI00332F65BC
MSCSSRDQVVAEHHDELFAGYFSVKKTLQKLKLCFYWPVQGQERRQYPTLHSIPVGEPFAIVGMDFKEMDESFDKNRYALVFQDYLTKWPELYAVADRTAATACC